MYKVLIVDDELLVRNYVRSLLDWEDFGFEVCGEAANGMEAMEKIKSYRPELVIMDISMPVMDGVVLSERIAKEYPHSRMFALSGYDDYQYVRKTLTNGAIDYILKDRLDEEELARILRQVKNIIEKEEYQKTVLKSEEHKIELFKEIAAEQYIKELFFGTRQYTDEIICSMGLSLNKICEKGYVVAVMQIGNYFIRTNGMSDSDKEKFVRSVKNLCGQSIEEQDENLVTYLGEGRFGFVFHIDSYCSEASLYGWLNQITNKISFTLNKYINVQALWGFSRRSHSSEKISSCFQDALRVLKAKLQEDSPERSPDSPEHSQGISCHSLSLRQEKELLVGIESGDQEMVVKTLDNIFSALAENGKDRESFQLIINELITTAMKISSEYNLDTSRIYQTCGVDIGTLTGEKNTAVIKSRIKSIYKALIEESVKKCYVGNYSEYSKKAIDYINLNYKKDISLVKMAEDIGISAAYFSRLFRKDTDYNFIEYVNKVRIEMAKKRLENGEKNLKKLCQDVGFKSYSYFFKVFKELSGTTPLSCVEPKSTWKN